jgi:hypothetical protein
MGDMKPMILALALALSPGMLAAEEPPSSDIDEGVSLMERGARLLFEGLISEMEPRLKDMAEGMEEFAGKAGPMLADLAAMIDEIGNYHAPVMMPNGDILIRRKTPEELALENGETEI